MAHRFYITDVFAEKRYAGNQLATVLGASDLSTAEMQAIAREFNFSETSFILADEPGEKGYKVRIFTPAEEVPFAGHPTLGTAYIIRRHLARGAPRQIVLDLKVGPIPVTFDGNDDVIWMKQRSPTFGRTVSREDAAELLGLKVEAIGDWPVEESSTGLPSLIVPLRGLRDLADIQVNKDMYRELCGRIDSKTILSFCPEAHEPGQNLAVRVHPAGVGIEEDPATGSGNGNLAAYLVKNRYFGTDEIDIKVGQGYEMGRPSQLYLRASRTDDNIEVRIGGKVFQVAEGRLG